MTSIRNGVRCMLPIIPGVIPFGLIMGTAAFNADLSLIQTLGLNLIVFAGASQLVAVDLMTQNMQSSIIVLTGLVINLRMFLYSASMAPMVKHTSIWTKSWVSYFLTDQAYAVMIHHESTSADIKDKLAFYFGAATLMSLSWHVSVVIGYFFGNIAPAALSLSFAVPLSFLALSIPTLKTRVHWYVFMMAAVLSILLYSLAYNLGLIVSTVVSIAIGAWISRPSKEAMP